MLPNKKEPPLLTPEELDAQQNKSHLNNILEELQHQQAQAQKEAGEHYVSYQVETIADGKYCPKIVLSTNDKTQYVTMTFTPIVGPTLDIRITKSEFLKYTTNLTTFVNAFMHDAAPTKQLIRD